MCEIRPGPRVTSPPGWYPGARIGCSLRGANVSRLLQGMTATQASWSLPNMLHPVPHGDDRPNPVDCPDSRVGQLTAQLTGVKLHCSPMLPEPLKPDSRALR